MQFETEKCAVYPETLMQSLAESAYSLAGICSYKDWSNLRTLNIGDGQIDFNSFFEFINKNNYQGDYTVEATAFDKDGGIHFEKINASLQKLREKAGQ